MSFLLNEQFFVILQNVHRKTAVLKLCSEVFVILLNMGESIHFV